MHRILLEQIEAAVRKSRASSRDIEETVHEVRKHLKKSRAVLRTMRAEISAAQFKGENTTLRDAGRKLSAVRDAAVRVKTMEKLLDQAAVRRTAFSKVRRRLVTQARQQASRATSALAAALPLLEEAEAKLARMPLDALDADKLSAAMHRTYKKARAAFRTYQETSSRDCLHELRKRLKDFGYQLRIIRPIRSGVLEQQSHQIEFLNELLGDNLDLAVMRDALSSGEWTDGAAAERDELCRLIEARREEMAADIVDCCELLFLESPSDFHARVAAYFAEAEKQKKASAPAS